MEVDTQSTAYHASFLERFLIFLGSKFDKYETDINALERKILGKSLSRNSFRLFLGLTGKLKEEEEKNYEQ